MYIITVCYKPYEKLCIGACRNEMKMDEVFGNYCLERIRKSAPTS